MVLAKEEDKDIQVGLPYRQIQLAYKVTNANLVFRYLIWISDSQNQNYNS